MKKLLSLLLLLQVLLAHAGNNYNILDTPALSVPVSAASGGTGVANNSASTLTVSGNFPTTLTVSASTGVTLPTTGTLSTLAGVETLSNKALTGTATNNNAATGIVGEYVTSTLASGTPISLSTGTAADVTSISLTAGDWDVSGQVGYSANAATIISNMQQGISTTSATIGAQGTYSTALLGATVGVDPVNQTPTVRLSLAGTTTVYLVAKSAFSINTLGGYGTIIARRRR